ncbi:MAG: ATP-binding cassette domain-containing protein [Gammaproteobacteria bacterium]|jgi:tungstate transport system ATP-binding protein|nr:ATP-binding cassette domain-containing protein [Gammaproteobacteria bacterium]
MTDGFDIRFIDIAKRYRGRNVLDGVDISLGRGQCTLLSGVNGTGKTLKIMAGLGRPDRGTIDTGLLAMPWLRCRRALQDEIMYLHQQPYMFDTSVVKNIAHALPRFSSPVNRDRIDETLLRSLAERHLQLEGGRLNPVTRDTVADNVSAFRLATASRHHKA